MHYGKLQVTMTYGFLLINIYFFRYMSVDNPYNMSLYPVGSNEIKLQ